MESSYSWKAISVGVGALAAIGMRKAIARMWPGASTPPLNPADRRIQWREALLWALSSGIGAGVARLVSQRAAAKGWEAATGNTPPGIKD